MKRLSYLIATTVALLLLAVSAGGGKPPGGGGGGGGSGNNTFSGQAVVVDASVLGIRTVVSDTGPLPSGGGCLEASLLTVNQPGLVTASVAHAATVGQGDRSRAEASVANVELTVAGNTISAGFLMARAMAKCGRQGVELSGSSEIASLSINGQAITVSGQPNQTVNLIVGYVVINEQVSSSANNYGAIMVTALHVVIPGIADVAISSAEADITCNGGPCNGGDFVTGGGWITGTPSGALGNFAVAGGIKNDGFWGHLVFHDHSNGMKVKGTSITSYTVTGTTSRRITGTAEINGTGGFTFTVNVADNGEPGRNDTFNLSLSSGYNAGGKLDGGNIQLHKPCR